MKKKQKTEICVTYLLLEDGTCLLKIDAGLDIFHSKYKTYTIEHADFKVCNEYLRELLEIDSTTEIPVRGLLQTEVVAVKTHKQLARKIGKLKKLYKKFNKLYV